MAGAAAFFAGGGAGAFFAGPERGTSGRRARIGLAQLGQSPVQVMRPGGAVVSTWCPQAAQVPETRNWPSGLGFPAMSHMYHRFTLARKVIRVALTSDAVLRLGRFAEAVARARAATSDTVATRNLEVYRARQAGGTVAEIARACRMSGVQVQTILVAQTTAEQNRHDAAQVEHNPGAVSA